jgi:alpha-beta hydrolase superfamily lysophospholipase
MFTTKDGIKIFTKQWVIDTPKAHVVLVHGFGEHIARYDHVAAALNRAGYSVYGSDLRGHGQSAHSEGQPRGYIASIDQYVDDVKVLWDQVKAPNLPNILIGHSMGGIVAARFALRHQAEMHALVTSGAALIPAPVPPFVVSLMKGLAGVAPHVGAIAVPAKYISTDPAEVRKYETDPLVHHGKVPLGTIAAMTSDGQDTLNRAHQLHIPLLVMQGSADKVISPTGSQKLFERAGSADKTLKMYPDLYHEIFNEVSKQQIIAEMIAWLDQRVGAR